MRLVFRIIIIIVIIVGGVLIFYPPKPEPECLVCRQGFPEFAGYINVLLGISMLVIENKLNSAKFAGR